jgi:hypothetical protein
MSDEEKIVDVSQLPEDPFKMPPPYWRSGGAIFHVQESLEVLLHLLEKLIGVHDETELSLEEYYQKHPEPSDEESDDSEFADICDALWELEHRVKLKCEVAVLMSAIEAEDSINRFCVYNLSKHIAEPIETLSPPEKLIVASAVLGQPSPKGKDVFESIRKLSAWRNAFAHGHCVDRPTKSLRHNHLISPSEYPGIPSSLGSVKELVGGFTKVSDYLKSISKNPYTSGESADVEEIRSKVRALNRYRFVGNNYAYSIEVTKA